MAQATARTYEGTHGTITIAEEGYYYSAGRAIARYDGYTAFSDGCHTIDSIQCRSDRDVSRQYDGPYTPHCYGCYAGYGHTEDYHYNRG